MPGEASSIVTCLDGHQMARQGRAGPALAIAALGSVFGGIAATFFIALSHHRSPQVALLFGPGRVRLADDPRLIVAVAAGQGSVPQRSACLSSGFCLAPSVSMSCPAHWNDAASGMADGLGSCLSHGSVRIGEIIANLEKKEQKVVVESRTITFGPLATTSVAAGRWCCVRLASVRFSACCPGARCDVVRPSLHTRSRRRLSADHLIRQRCGRGARLRDCQQCGRTDFVHPALTLGSSNAVIALMAGAMMITASRRC